LRYPTGYQGAGDQDDPRARLLALAGFDEDSLARIAKASIDKKLALLEATKKTYASFNGTIEDERSDPDTRTQLEASRALDEIIGIKSPPAKQTITVVHKVELPAWMLPDDQLTRTIEVSSVVS
jgi:hypothetical protein